MPAALVLDAPPERGLRPGPEQPCIILPAPWERPILFTSLSALGRGLHKRRAGRALRFEPTTATYFGSDSFPVFKVFFGDEASGGERFAFTVAGIGDRRELLELTLRTTNPDAP